MTEPDNSSYFTDELDDRPWRKHGIEEPDDRPWRKRNKQRKRYGIESRFVVEPCENIAPSLASVYDWHKHQYYATEARRDQALTVLQAKGIKGVYVKQEYRKCQR